MAYLVIGIFWGAFMAQKSVEMGWYDKDTGSANRIVLINTFSWPIAIPTVIYAFATK